MRTGNFVEISVDDIPLSIGKYLGKTPREISKFDPSYVIWLYDNRVVNVTRDLYRDCDDRLQSQDDGYPIGDGYRGNW